MRTIKFRCWDSNLKQFLSNNIVNIGCNGVLYDECAIYNNRDERDKFWTLHQFTGLLDKNGKEIYEGDLLEFAYRDDGMQFVGEVQYFKEFGSFGVVIDKAFETFQDLIEYDQFFNVVGNIFETKLDVPQETL